jgi:hypothetical protein
MTIPRSLFQLLSIAANKKDRALQRPACRLVGVR